MRSWRRGTWRRHPLAAELQGHSGSSDTRHAHKPASPAPASAARPTYSDLHYLDPSASSHTTSCSRGHHVLPHGSVGGPGRSAAPTSEGPAGWGAGNFGTERAVREGREVMDKNGQSIHR